MQILPLDPLQPHQLPCEQQLSMSSGVAINETQLTRCSHSLPSQAGSFTAVPSEDGAPHIQPQDQSMWKQLCPHCIRDTATHTDTNTALSTELCLKSHVRGPNDATARLVSTSGPGQGITVQPQKPVTPLVSGTARKP